MWNKSLSVNLANLLNIAATIPGIYNFSQGFTFLARPVDFNDFNVFLVTFFKKNQKTADFHGTKTARPIGKVRFDDSVLKRLKSG